LIERRQLRKLALGCGEQRSADDVAELLEQVATEHLLLRNEVEVAVKGWRSKCKCVGSIDKSIGRLAKLIGVDE
jgi:hypothetical protein